jgi:endonuclease/exonuclease/phosphatase family metal-dependent hydrolase
VSAGLPPSLRPLVVATYNVHGWVGIDGRRDPERSGETLAELGADVIALQEVRCGPDGPGILERIAEMLKMESLRGMVHEWRDEAHGNALLSRLAITAAEPVELTVGGREPRGAIVATLDTGAEPLLVVATHLGIGPRERRLQVRRLVAHLPPAEAGALVVLGDMNEWVRGAGALLPLHRRLGRTPGPRTFPTPFPLFSLDRIWVFPRWRLRRLWVHRSPLSRAASDHLPLLAELDAGLSSAPPGGPPS